MQHSSSRKRIWIGALVIVLMGAAAYIAAASSSNARHETVVNAERLTHGTAAEGPDKIRKYGCYSCHTIPGVDGANGLVGPPLKDIVDRTYIAGRLPNTPANIALWIQHPHSVDPHTVMPEMGVTEQDSRDIAAYLYTQR